MPTHTRAPIILILAAAILTLQGCLDDGGSDPTPPVATPPAVPQAATLETTRNDLVIDAVGKSVALTITPVDSTGNPVSVMVTYASSDPAVAAVDTMGNVTALAIGSAEVVATVDGAASVSGDPIEVRVDVTVAELKMIAHLLPAEAPDSVKIERLTNDGGYVVRFLLDAAIYSVNGGDWVTTDDWSIVGRVLSSVVDGNNLIVEVESGQPIDVIENGQFEFEAGIDEFEFPTEVAIPVEAQPVTSKPGAQPIAQSIQREVRGYNSLLNILFPGEFTTSISQNFKCKVNNRGSRAFNIETDLNPTIRFDGINYQVEQDAVFGFANSGRFSVDANFVVTFDGRIDWDGQLRGTVVCKDTLAAPFIQEGPLVLSLPSGIGFSFTAEVDDLSGTAFISGEMPVSMLVGLGYDLDNALFLFLDAPVELEADTDDLDVRFEVPDVSDEDAVSGQLKFEAFAFSVLRAGAGLGTFFGIYKKFDSLKAGVRETFDIASAQRQARDASLNAKVELEVFLKRDLADPQIFFSAPPMLVIYPAIVVADAAGLIDIETLLDYELSATLATTPRGDTQVPVGDLAVGEPADFSITLDPVTWLGFYQIDDVAVYRLDGEGEFSILTEVARVEASTDQTTFDWSWTPAEADVGVVQFVTFVNSDLYAGQPIQVEEVFQVTVEGDDTVPIPEVEILTDARVRINGDIGRLRDGRYEFERISVNESSDRQPNATFANASLEGMTATATADAGRIAVQLQLDADVCGNFNLFAGGDIDINLSNFPEGSQIAMGGSINGPRAFSVSMTPDDISARNDLELEVQVFSSVDDDGPMSGFSDNLSGDYQIRGSEVGWDTTVSPFDNDRRYTGGGAGFGTEALTLIDGSGRGSLGGGAGLSVQLDLDCEQNVTNRRFNAAFTITFTPVY